MTMDFLTWKLLPHPQPQRRPSALTAAIQETTHAFTLKRREGTGEPQCITIVRPRVVGASQTSELPRKLSQDWTELMSTIVNWTSLQVAGVSLRICTMTLCFWALSVPITLKPRPRRITRK